MHVFGNDITGGGVVVHITTGGVLPIRYRRVVIFNICSFLASLPLYERAFQKRPEETDVGIESHFPITVHVEDS